MTRSLKSFFVLFFVVLCYDLAVSQVRTFSENPQVMLGLRSDRSPSLTFADIDNDGDIDVLVASGRHWPQQNEVFINNGFGGFTVGYALGSEYSTSYSIPVADLDGDGDLDAVVANDMATNMIYLNDGRGHYTLAGNLGPEVESTRDVILADLNGDGLPDAIVTNRGMENGIYLNIGGSFGVKQGFGSNDDSTISLAVADIDRDGRPDLVLANRDGQANFIHLNDESLGFETAVQYGTGSDETRAVAVADMNLDGHLDIVTANIGEANGIYFGDGSGGFDSGVAFGSEDGRTYDLEVVDLDNDGDMDIVVVNVRSQNAVFFNDGTGKHFVEVRFGSEDDISYGVAVGDVDGDGFPDIGVANSDGINGIYISQPTLAAKIEAHHRIYLPGGDGPFPTVVTIPGCSGVSLDGPSTDEGRPGDEGDRLFRRHYSRMAERLRARGFAVVLVDYLTAEGVANTCASEISHERVGEYVGASLEFAGDLPSTDPRALFVIGWSHGGAGVIAWLQALGTDHSPAVGAVAVYPECDSRGPWRSSMPILLLLGGADDIALPERCDRIAGQLPEETDAVFLRYPESRHGFDLTEGPEVLDIGGGMTLGRNDEAGEAAWSEIFHFLEEVSGAF